MSGGTIVTRSSVSDFAGAEMKGGTLRIQGDAGDLVGGSYPGSKIGMNRGTILVGGNVGKGAGQSLTTWHDRDRRNCRKVMWLAHAGRDDSGFWRMRCGSRAPI